MKKTTKSPLLLKRLCIISLAFTVPVKASASPDCCTSWAIAGGVIWGGGIACAAVTLCTINTCQALRESCGNCFQSLYKWIDKKEEESSSQSTPLLKQVKGPSGKYGDDKGDIPLPALIFEPKSVATPPDNLHDLFSLSHNKSARTSNLFEKDED